MDSFTPVPQPPTTAPEVAVTRVFGDPLSAGEPGALSLAQTLVASPFFGSLEGAVAAYRSGVGMMVVGRLSEGDLARLQAFEEELRRGRERLLLLSYRDIEELTGQLAGRLAEVVGDALGDATFHAIPRGGLVVLGLLAYHMALRPRQLAGPPGHGRPLVVIDDCSISGRRFHEVLRALPGGEPVVFGTLFSHPDLRRRILDTEDRVQAVVSARDLEDHAPSILGGEYEAWRARWSRRDLEGYWEGIADHIVFPWSEPDMAVWDAASGDTVHGWRIAPPDRCLKNRLALRRHQDRLQVNEPSPVGFAPAPDVIYAHYEGSLVVTSFTSGQVWSMEGSAPLLWQALATEDGVERAATSLAETIDLSVDELARELADFAADMVARGLMNPMP